uniref:Protein ENHANCED DISEASE RESISTANCE 2 C-terminal domain-containing protein n=1 Tax=Ciona intestinalis TaxID=7719 RepID=Q69HP6_CIOIN|nr:hypothetical protein cihA5H10 [Ciona intestinalis]
MEAINNHRKPNSHFPLFPTLINTSGLNSEDSNTLCDPIEYKYNIRSKDYLQTGVKQPSNAPLYSLIGADLFMTSAKENITNSNSLRASSFRNARKNGFKRFVLILNFKLNFGNFIVYWTPKTLVNDSYLTTSTSFNGLLEQFIEKDDTYRNSRLKIIPVLIEGSWILMPVITGKPAIIGTKIDTNWVVNLGEGENFIEANINISDSSIANGILNMTKAYINKIVLDLAFTIEGKTEDELPEEILCSLRLNKMNMSEGITLHHTNLFLRKSVQDIKKISSQTFCNSTTVTYPLKDLKAILLI